MLIFRGQMLQNHILEPHFVNNPLLAPKWDHHTAAPKLFFTDFDAPGRLQNSQKSIKIGIKIGCFFEVPPGRPPEGSWMPN